MRRAHLTACAIFVSLAAGCGDGKHNAKGTSGDSGEPEAAGSTAKSAVPSKTPSFHAQSFRDATLPGPAYVATSDQLLIIDTDGRSDVVSESLGIAQIKPLPTGDVLVRSASGLSRVRGRAVTAISTSVPAAAIEVALAGDDDVWAVGKRAVHHFDGKDWGATPVPGIKGEPSLRDVAIDVRGVAWLAAGADGLFEWDGARWRKHDAVKEEVLDVAAVADGVVALLPSGFVEIKNGNVSDLVKRTSTITGGDMAADGSWIVLGDDGAGSRSFAIGKGAAETWTDRAARLGPDAVWFAADTRARIWVANKRSVAVVGKEQPDTTIPLNAAATGELVAIEVVGAGPETLPAEVGPSVSMPIPFDPKSATGDGSTPLPSGSAKQGNVIINAEPGFADGVVSNASSVVAGMAAGFRRCYNRGLLENPSMKGSLRITTKIGPNGEVLSATPSTGSGLSQSVVSCLSARVASATFAKPNGGGATVIIPVSLLPQP